MSLLSTIRQTLEEKAIIAHVGEERPPLELCRGWPHRVDFYIAPKEGIYSADGLNQFMDSLFPDIQPDHKSYFMQTKDALIAGALCFDEKIGEEIVRVERDVRATDSEFAAGIESQKGSLHSFNVSIRDYMRRITVRPFPNREIAEHIYHSSCPKWKIGMELIREYHDERNFLQKFFSRLHHQH